MGPARRPDATDYERRGVTNLAAVIALLCLGIAVVWVLLALEGKAKLDRCLAGGRRDCGRFDAATPGPASIRPPRPYAGAEGAR